MNTENGDRGRKEITIIVATHKNYRMPEDKMYLPLHVGAEGKTDENGNPLELGYTKDNTGDNISYLNASFCELTGLYWAWKNLDSDYIGIVHYRRHFGRNRYADPFRNILTFHQIRPFLGKTRVFVPKKRKYFIESLYSHYKHTHYIEQLDETRKIISELCPEYVRSFDRVVHRTRGYMFNIMILEKKLLDQYCTWLFQILFELRRRMEGSELIKDYSDFQIRFYGRVGEIIFNVWLDWQLQSGSLKTEELRELSVIHIGEINWWKKGNAFLKAKFAGKKYEASF